MKIEGSDGKSAALTQVLATYSAPVRTRRAAKGFALGFGLALCSLPIPALHFALVPGFLIFAVYSAYSRFRETHSVDLSEAKCPGCGKPLSEKTLHFSSLPVQLYCFECRTQLRIVE